jgi:hypothetical protein
MGCSSGISVNFAGLRRALPRGRRRAAVRWDKLRVLEGPAQRSAVGRDRMARRAQAPARYLHRRCRGARSTRSRVAAPAACRAAAQVRAQWARLRADPLVCRAATRRSGQAPRADAQLRRVTRSRSRRRPLLPSALSLLVSLFLGDPMSRRVGIALNHGPMPSLWYPIGTLAPWLSSGCSAANTPIYTDFVKGERGDSNPRPPGPQPGALPTELRPPRETGV